MNSFEKKFEEVFYVLPNGDISACSYVVDADFMATQRADEAAISGVWVKYARPGFEESARQIADIALIDRLHEEALLEDETREHEAYCLEQEKPIAEGVMHGPYLRKDSRDFYSQSGGHYVAIDGAVEGGKISYIRSDALKDNLRDLQIKEFNAEQDFEILHEIAQDENDWRDFVKEEEEKQRIQREDEEDLASYGDDLDDEEEYGCQGCGQSNMGCVCAEIESLRRHNADPNTRGSYWTA